MPSSDSSKYYFTYILESKKSKNLYYGYTNNIKNRLKLHNQGKVKSTKTYTPWELIYFEACLDKNDAKRRERYFKTTIGRRMLRKRLRNYFIKFEDILLG